MCQSSFGSELLQGYSVSLLKVIITFGKLVAMVVMVLCVDTAPHPGFFKASRW